MSCCYPAISVLSQQRWTHANCQRVLCRLSSANKQFLTVSGRRSDLIVSCIFIRREEVVQELVHRRCHATTKFCCWSFKQAGLLCSVASRCVRQGTTCDEHVLQTLGGATAKQ